MAEARRLAAAAGVANASFAVTDVEAPAFRPGVFDLVLSKFGLTSFDDPAAAFASLRKALRRGGRLAFLCWRTRNENPVFAAGFAQTAAVLGLGEPPGPSAAFPRRHRPGDRVADFRGVRRNRVRRGAEQVRDRYLAYASPDGVTMPAAAWLVTAQAA